LQCVGRMTAGRNIVNSIQTIYQWGTQYPFTAATVFFGGLILAVTLYTYVYDYRMLTDRD